MEKRIPLIGITPWYNYQENMTYIKKGYCEGVSKAGGLGVVLPLATDERMLSEIVDRFDGFLLSGGPDIDAALYGEANLPFNGEISPYRDTMEIFIARRAIEYNKPLFGICRGLQVMNVALGGTLYQDIYSQKKDVQSIQHSQNAPKWHPTHDVFVEKDSKVWASFMRECISVNSFHHQAIKDVAPGFSITSQAVDGIVESIEYAGHRFAVGVQWHPELMWEKDEAFLKLFEAFVNSCKNLDLLHCT